MDPINTMEVDAVAVVADEDDTPQSCSSGDGGDDCTTDADESPPRSQSRLSQVVTPTPASVKYNNNTIHHLPCSIDYNGPAPIEDYFRIAECSARGEGKYVSHFRGRQLFGERVKLPGDVQGLCVRSTPSGLLPKWSVKGKFDEIMAWEHDRLPETTSIKNMAEWMELSDAVWSFVMSLAIVALFI